MNDNVIQSFGRSARTTEGRKTGAGDSSFRHCKCRCSLSHGIIPALGTPVLDIVSFDAAYLMA